MLESTVSCTLRKRFLKKKVSWAEIPQNIANAEMAYLLNQRGKYNKIYISVKKILFKFPQHMQYQKYPKVSN